MRPADLPPAESFAHGTRARYVSGCRCDPCRASNTRAYHDRQARAKALAAEIDVDVGPVGQAWTAPDGSRKIRMYRRACPGPGGFASCPRSAHLRRDSKGGVCRTCRELLIWNGNVWAGEVRAHLRKLSRAGVGYKSVAAACDVPPSSLAAILRGEKRYVRQRTAERIVAVTRDAVADHGLVDAGPTWRLIGQMLEAGLTRGRIAQRLGCRTPALQLRRGRVLARTAHAVRRLHARVMVEVARQAQVDATIAEYRRIEEEQAA